MPIPQSLQDKLRKRQVIPFVGAGVSMSVLDRISHEPVFPGWRQLLSEAADRLDKEMKFAEAGVVRALLSLQRPDFLYAAQHAREALGGVWYEFLNDALNTTRAGIEETSLELARSVWRLGSNLIITTNYDEVLRWACPEYDDLQIWHIQAPVPQALLLRGELDRPVVWHLHGHISNPSEIILSRDAYQLLYPDTNRNEREGQYKAALATLHHLAIAKSLIFVGFSLDDEYLGLELKSIYDIYKGAGQHFALVRESDAERIRSFKMGIEPITFEDFGEPFLDLVRELEGLVKSKAHTSNLSTPSSERTVLVQDYGPHRSVFHVPFKQKGNEMVGQEQVLADVRKQLTAGKRTAIGQTAAFRGLGGLGKTQLAIEYAYRYRDEYPNGVIWINADQDIDAQLIEIAGKGRWIAPESDHKYKIQIAQQRIRSYSDCLIVFDNLDELAAIEPYLPETGASPHILVTSRVDHAGFQPVPLELLDTSSSRELLVKEAGREPDNEKEEEAAEGIVALLGGLPLALELAGAYLGHRSSVTFQQYSEMLSKDLRSALPKAVRSFTEHEADLYSTLRLSEALLEEEPHLRDVLDLLTWSGSAPMSTDLMSHLLDVPYDGTLVGSLALGAELRLLQQSEKSNSYSLHRLVGEVRRGEIPLEQRTQWVDAVCNRLGNWFQEKREDFAQLTRFESEIDHLKKWQENAMYFARSHASRLMWLQAYPAYHRGRYVESRNYVSEAQRIFEQLGNTNLELQAHLLNDLAYTNLVLNDGGPVLEMFMQALRLRRELFGERHPDVATSLGNLGGWYGEQEKIPEGLEYSEQALNMYQELLGDLHPDVAHALNNIGRLYGRQGDVERALMYAEQALTMRRELFGSVHPDIADSLSHVGQLYGKQGNIERAREYAEQALVMRRELFGEIHPDIARSLRDVGQLYGRQENFERALEFAQQCLAMRSELFGKQHSATIHAAAWLAQVLIRLRRYKEAYDLVAHFLTQVSTHDSAMESLKRLEQQLLSNTIRKGFRQPPRKGKGKARKKRR